MRIMKNSVYKSDAARDAFRAQYAAILGSFPFGQQYVDTSYGKTFLLTAGLEALPPALILHGSCSNSAFMTPELAAISGEYRAYAADIIGEAGNSAEFRPELTSDAYALWLREVMDALHVDRTIVVGSSLGGWLALKLAVTFPERVSRLILIAPGGLSAQKREIVEMADRARARNETLTMDASVTGGAALPREVIDFMNLILMSYYPITEILPVFTDAQLQRLQMPVLFVAGENDVMLDMAGAAARLRSNVPHAEVHLLKDAGHIILNAAEYILPFLRKGS